MSQVLAPQKKSDHKGAHPQAHRDRGQTRSLSKAGNVSSSVYDVLESPGSALDTKARQYFEPRFGRDFSKVRIHADSAAAASAREINANAYAVGQNIVFGAGKYSSESPAGKKLLAHELAHTVQQSHASEGPLQVQALDVGKANGGEERQAGALAEKMTTFSEPSMPARRASASLTALPKITLQRDEEKGRAEQIFDYVSEGIGKVSEKVHEGITSVERMAIDKIRWVQHEVFQTLWPLKDKLPARYRPYAEKIINALDAAVDTLATYLIVIIGIDGGLLKGIYDIVEGLLSLAVKLSGMLIAISISDSDPSYLEHEIKGLENAVMNLPGALKAMLEKWQADYKAADRDEKKRLVADFGGQVVALIASFFVGAGEVRAVAKGAELGDLGRGASEASKLEEAAKIAKLAEEEQAANKAVHVLETPKEAPHPVTPEPVEPSAQPHEAKTPTETPKKKPPEPKPAEAPKTKAPKPKPKPAEAPKTKAPKPKPKPAEAPKTKAPKPKPKPAEAPKTKAPKPKPKPAEAPKTKAPKPKPEPAEAIEPTKTESKKTTSSEKKRSQSKGEKKETKLSPMPKLTESQIEMIKKTMGQKSLGNKRLAELWEKAANPGEKAGLTIKNSRRLFDNQRDRFWRMVFNDKGVGGGRDVIEKMGFTFPRAGKAPVLTLPDGKAMQITLDHIIERQTDFTKALDAPNLQLSPRGENTVLLRQITEQDPFQDPEKHGFTSVNPPHSEKEKL